MSDKYALEIMWYITERCNLNCKHCYANTIDTYNELSFIEVKRLIDQMVELEKYYKIVRIGLLGGEPFLRKDILKIIENLVEKEFKVNIATNGTYITSDIAKKLKSLEVSFMQLSLESPDKNLNDRIRGKGSFDRTIRAVRILIDTGIDVGIRMTVHKENLKQIKEMIEFASSLGVNSVSFSRYIPIGNGVNEMKDLVLTKNDFKEMVYTIMREKAKRKDPEIWCEEPLFFVEFFRNYLKKNYKKGGCSAGISVIAILPDGTVFPCRKLPISLGNIKERRLVEILTNNKVIYDLKMRNLKGKCYQCKYRYICGGCRGFAFSISGDYLNEDPLCWYDKEEVQN